MIRKFLGKRLVFDGKMVILTVGSTLLVLLAYYYRMPAQRHWESLLLFLAVPIILTLAVFKDPLRKYGVQLGDWQAGLLITAGGILLMTPVVWLLGRHHVAVQGYYRHIEQGLIWKMALEMVGWEFLFRGWLLFGYAEKYGPDALWLQAVPFALAHIGKPDIETLSTIFGGVAFGWVAWRTQSFVYAFLIHWYIGALIVIVSAGA
jgi:membrane protease YdiL (CAAX protease family)